MYCCVVAVCREPCCISIRTLLMLQGQRQDVLRHRAPVGIWLAFGWHLTFGTWAESSPCLHCVALSRHSPSGRFVSFVALSGRVVALPSPASLTHGLADNTCQPPPTSSQFPVSSGLLSTSTSTCHLSRPMPAATTCTSSLMPMLMLL
jgi:hypothetical protein